MPKTQWAQMTWKEIRDAAEQNSIVIAPIGTTETQGPYNMVGYESILVERVSAEVAKHTNSLVLPTIPFGASDSFADVPGTISIRPHILEGLYEDTLQGVAKFGFDHILVVGAHVPNQPILSQVFRKLRKDHDLLAIAVNLGRIAPNYVKELFDDPGTARGHGAEPGLSIGEYLCPDAVDRSEAKPIETLSEFRGFNVSGMSLKFQDFDVLAAIQVEDISPQECGAGDPTQGSEEHGQIMFERMVESLTELAETFRGMDTSAPTEESLTTKR